MPQQKLVPIVLPRNQTLPPATQSALLDLFLTVFPPPFHRLPTVFPPTSHQLLQHHCLSQHDGFRLDHRVDLAQVV
jgi:hypothetical protein